MFTVTTGPLVMKPGRMALWTAPHPTGPLTRQSVGPVSPAFSPETTSVIPLFHFSNTTLLVSLKDPDSRR